MPGGEGSTCSLTLYLLACLQEERQFLTAQHAEEVAELGSIIATIDAFELEREAEARQEHEQLREVGTRGRRRIAEGSGRGAMYGGWM